MYRWRFFLPDLGRRGIMRGKFRIIAYPECLSCSTSSRNAHRAGRTCGPHCGTVWSSPSGKPASQVQGQPSGEQRSHAVCCGLQSGEPEPVWGSSLSGSLALSTAALSGRRTPRPGKSLPCGCAHCCRGWCGALPL